VVVKLACLALLAHDECRLRRSVPRPFTQRLDSFRDARVERIEIHTLRFAGKWHDYAEIWATVAALTKCITGKCEADLIRGGGAFRPDHQMRLALPPIRTLGRYIASRLKIACGYGYRSIRRAGGSVVLARDGGEMNDSPLSCPLFNNHLVLMRVRFRVTAK
jgi:hypothetical protein